MDVVYPDKNLLDNSDSRYFPRWEISNPVLYRYEDQESSYRGKTKDLSCAGTCIRGKDYVVPGQELNLTITIADHVNINLKGKILWIRPEKEDFQIGVSFHEVPDKIQDLILKHAFEVDRDKLIKHWFQGWIETS